LKTRKAKEIKKVWGEEVEIVNIKENNYCGKFLRYNNGWSSSLHMHRLKNETFYVLGGTFKFEYLKGKSQKKTTWLFSPNEIIDIPKGVYHRLTALSEGCLIIEFSNYHSDEDVYRLEESKKTGKEKQNGY